ncbi:MAG: O-acetyl-ADP-ribose deacetylase [Alphaproteobacteria bacterium]
MLNRISVVEGDITKQQVDAIINAANTELCGGGGVDGAIHRAAGPALADTCRTIGGCPTGQAVTTDGYDLAARWVIHTAGPVWRGGSNDEDFLLASCYRNSLALAEDHTMETIAFPAINTGVYGFPAPRAARIAVTETVDFLHGNALPGSVTFVCFDRQSFDCHKAAVADIIA